MTTESKCPTCTSPAPHLHPSVQSEGEVQPCRDPFHLTPTAENTPQKIAETRLFFEMRVFFEGMATA